MWDSQSFQRRRSVARSRSFASSNLPVRTLCRVFRCLCGLQESTAEGKAKTESTCIDLKMYQWNDARNPSMLQALRAILYREIQARRCSVVQ
jgi:hypothetical protein